MAIQESMQYGGIHVDSSVEVLVDGKGQTVKVGDLKPGDFLNQTGQAWFMPLDALVISRRRQTAFRLKLESGEELTVAAGTILCGQYGPNLVAKTPDQVLCLVNLGRFNDHLHHSRRQFIANFIAPEPWLTAVQRICRHSHKSRFHSSNEKKFYTWYATERFLRKLHVDQPDFRIVPGMRVEMTDEGVYDLLKAVIPMGKGFYVETSAFMPLFQLQKYDGHTPTDVALMESAYKTSHRKVVSCEVFESDGPWATPVFDVGSDVRGSCKFRNSFVANKIPVFLPNPFISDFAITATMAHPGQEPFPPEKYPPDPMLDIESIYDSMAEGQPKAPLSAEDKRQTFEALTERLSKLAAADVPWDTIEQEVRKRVKRSRSAS